MDTKLLLITISNMSRWLYAKQHEQVKLTIDVLDGFVEAELIGSSRCDRGPRKLLHYVLAAHGIDDALHHLCKQLEETIMREHDLPQLLREEPTLVG